MPNHRKQIRGENRVSNALNRPIKGVLGKKRSKSFVFVFGIIAAMALCWYASSKLGFKAGAVVTLLSGGFVVFYYFEQKMTHKKTDS